MYPRAGLPDATHHARKEKRVTDASRRVAHVRTPKQRSQIARAICQTADSRRHLPPALHTDAIGPDNAFIYPRTTTEDYSSRSLEEILAELDIQERGVDSRTDPPHGDLIEDQSVASVDDLATPSPSSHLEMRVGSNRDSGSGSHAGPMFMHTIQHKTSIKSLSSSQSSENEFWDACDEITPEALAELDEEEMVESMIDTDVESSSSISQSSSSVFTGSRKSSQTTSKTSLGSESSISSIEQSEVNVGAPTPRPKPQRSVPNPGPFSAPRIFRPPVDEESVVRDTNLSPRKRAAGSAPSDAPMSGYTRPLVHTPPSPQSPSPKRRQRNVSPHKDVAEMSPSTSAAARRFQRSNPDVEMLPPPPPPLFRGVASSTPFPFTRASTPVTPGKPRPPPAEARLLKLVRHHKIQLPNLLLFPSRNQAPDARTLPSESKFAFLGSFISSMRREPRNRAKRFERVISGRSSLTLPSGSSRTICWIWPPNQFFEFWKSPMSPA
ncbi:hypothetical protein EVG20_g7988, partial [Dentipellis fragilis]